MQIPKNVIYHLSLITLFGFSFLGWLIIEWGHGKHFLTVFESEYSFFIQILYGLVYGAICGFIALWIVSTNLLKPMRIVFKRLIKSIDLSIYDIILLSACAAIGEEILFRAALQPIFGIWITAIIFVGLHGYINPTKLKMSIYGIFMVFVSAGFGYSYEFFGLWTPIAAHFIINLILFLYLRK